MTHHFEGTEPMDEAPRSVPLLSTKASTRPILETQSEYAPGTWENPAPLQVKPRKRPPSPTSEETSPDQTRVFGRKRQGKSRRIQSPCSSDDAEPAAASGPVRVIPTLNRSGPRRPAETDDPSPAPADPAFPAFNSYDDPMPLAKDINVLGGANSVSTDDPLLRNDHSPRQRIPNKDITTPLSASDTGTACLSQNDIENTGAGAVIYPSVLTPPASAVIASCQVVPRQVQEAIKNVRGGVADVDVDSRSDAPSSALSIEDVSLEIRPIPAFKGLTFITGGLSALDYLRACRARRLASQLNIASAANPPPVSAPPSIQNASDAALEEDKMSLAEWRHIIEKYGDSDIEGLLDASTETPPSSPPSALEYSVVHVDPTHQPPPERRGKALRNFDYTTVDEWNRRAPTMTRNPQLHRAIFEAYIAQSELESGEIKVYNEVDAEGAPPDFEFTCSNDMLYHPEVPDPELGLGCDCEGPCDPKSKTCSCAKRQKLYSYLDLEGFAYDE